MYATAEDLRSNLHANHYGSQVFTRWSSIFSTVASEGAIALADKAQAYWLLDAIASHLPDLSRKHGFFHLAVANLSVADDGEAMLTIEIEDGCPVAKQQIEYTAFPSGDFTLFIGPNETGSYTIFLPSEY